MFGPHSAYIYASYGIAAAVVLILIAASYRARAAARRRLAELEQMEERP